MKKEEIINQFKELLAGKRNCVCFNQNSLSLEVAKSTFKELDFKQQGGIIVVHRK